MIPLATLRAEAEMLARQLPDALLNADAADVMHPGAAGRRRAGTGEDFWQYRRYAQTDAADQIDWRRSARGDDYFVRETELETARTILFWVDPLASFDWSGADTRVTKADRARILVLALGLHLAKVGERIGIFGNARGPSLGKAATGRLAEGLVSAGSHDTAAIAPPRGAGIAVIASDFYEGAEIWAKRLAPLAQTCREGVLVYISDPVEQTFPFTGRTRFSLPGTALTRLFGRAETAREAYLEKLEAHITALETLAAKMGWALVKHQTDAQALKGAAALHIALQQFGVRA